MAICHISISIISRGKGKTAVAAAAYRAGERIICEYDGRINDYSRKRGIVHKEILLPEHAPREYINRATLWNAIEKAERYKTAQLAREIVIALPIELNQNENIRLAREYVQKNFVNAGMCADLCVHDNNDGNPHAHILLSVRPIEKNGTWGQKSHNINGRKIPAVDWNEHTKAEEWRKAWADLHNEYFARNNINVKIDHRSFKRQGKEQIPTKHLGHEASQMERRGIHTVRGDWNRYAAVTNSELRQLNGRIRKVKNELYKLPLIDALSIVDVASKIGAWRNSASTFAKIQNLKEFASAVALLQKHGVRSMSELADRANDMYNESRNLATAVKKTERRIDTLSVHIAQYDIYKKYILVYQNYIKLAGNKKKQDAYYDKHFEEIDQFNDAKSYIEKIMNGRISVPRKQWEKELTMLLQKRWELCDGYYNLRSEIKTVEDLRRSVERLMEKMQLELVGNQLLYSSRGMEL